MFNNGNIWGGGIYWDTLTEERLKNPKCLEKYGYKVYSQNDEDGIIHEIFERIGTTNKRFVEFGVQNGLESNCHYLLFQGWSGLWLEGDETFCNEIRCKFKPVIESKRLKIENVFITRDNINEILSAAGYIGNIDLLSIDIDGNDYYVWQSIEVIQPRVVIIEYNGKFPPDCEWKMAYNKLHIWDNSDWHGASLKALEKLGEEKGYQLVGTNIQGANAFFVKKELTRNLFIEPATAEMLYNPLRLELFHRNGHPAKWCLVNQNENLGIFNYVNDRIAVPVSGFYSEEEGRFNWMSEKRALLYAKKQPFTKEIVIPYGYRNVVDQKEMVSIKVWIEDCKPQKFILASEGELVVTLPEKLDEIYQIFFEIDEMWSPQRVLHNGDERNLGIAVLFKNIVYR